eukprot:NODE_78_length_23230_cov_1.644979.p14 type:complete len:102 gc:universal NODE_78_length_23230_cov_1.644979:16558-16253(-)
MSISHCICQENCLILNRDLLKMLHSPGHALKKGYLNLLILITQKFLGCFTILIRMMLTHLKQLAESMIRKSCLEIYLNLFVAVYLLTLVKVFLISGRLLEK